MSERRIYIVCEGITDFRVIESALRSLRPARDWIPTMIQPDFSAAFEGLGPFGGGWKGVRGWCNETLPLLDLDPPDALIVHVDADVAHEDEVDCACPCPPPCDTTNALRSYIQQYWCNNQLPAIAVLCTPSKNTECWVLQALYPDDPFVRNGELECRLQPESLLCGKKEKLVRRKKAERGYKYQKNDEAYIAHQETITAQWDVVRQNNIEAARFSSALLEILRTYP